MRTGRKEGGLGGGIFARLLFLGGLGASFLVTHGLARILFKRVFTSFNNCCQTKFEGFYSKEVRTLSDNCGQNHSSIF